MTDQFAGTSKKYTFFKCFYYIWQHLYNTMYNVYTTHKRKHGYNKTSITNIQYIYNINYKKLYPKYNKVQKQ